MRPGGVDDLPTHPRVGSAFRLSTIGALLVGLGMLVASPHPVAAQGTCSVSDGTISETVPDGDPPEVTKTGQYEKQLLCQELTNGLKLTLDDFKIGTSDDPAEPRGLDVNADGAEGDDVTVMGKVVIHSERSGMQLNRNGKGLLKLRLDPGSEIKTALSDDDDVLERADSGIYLKHKGEAGEKTEGIHLESSADIDLSKSLYTGKAGIVATTEGAAEGTTIPITIHLKGGSIRAEDTTANTHQKGRGVDVNQSTKGNITITVAPGVMLGIEDKPIGAFGIYALIGSAGVGNIRITHQGHIYATQGIYADMSTYGSGNNIAGNIVIETGANSKIVTNLIGESAATTYTASGTDPDGIRAYINNNRIGTVTITHGGMIDAARVGITTYGNRAVTVTLKTGSRITAKGTGIIAQTYTTGIVTVKTEAGSTIASDSHGIQVRHIGTDKRKFHVAVHGTVTGGNVCTNTNTGRDKCAGVYVRNRAQDDDDPKLGGGTIVIGPWAHVKATSGVAIEVDGKAGDVAVILEKDEAGVVGHVEGQILHPKGADRTRDKAVEGEVTIKTRTISGTEEGLEAGDHVYRRGDRMGVYEQVIKAELRTIANPAGYEFRDVPGDLRLYSHRARLYEVLPSVLLGLVDLTPYSTRMAVPRRSTGEEVVLESSKGEHVATPSSRTGVWVRLAVRDGERMADTSTTATDFWRQSLAWDVKQTDFEAGLEVPTDDRLVLGVSAHYRQSKATVKNGGTMEASGTGVGVSLTWTDDSGLYVDGQLSYTRFFDVALTSSRQGVITSKGGGSGLAVGVEVGQPMSMGGMAVTPRGGLSWSSVDMDAFDEPTTIDGAGRVAPDKEQSVQGRVGVLAELGSGEADGRLYASLDLEHEFSSRHAVMVAGTRLATEVKPTWVRLGVGGAMPLGGHDTTMLTGDAFYATAGSDNTDFGGGLSVTFRF